MWGNNFNLVKNPKTDLFNVLVDDHFLFDVDKSKMDLTLAIINSAKVLTESRLNQEFSRFEADRDPYDKKINYDIVKGQDESWRIDFENSAEI